MPVVQSRVNGLKVNIPADAAGVVGRFQSKGDNELVFEKPKRQVARDVETAVVESIEPDNPKPQIDTSEFA